MKKTAVIIVHYKGLDLTHQAIESVLNSKNTRDITPVVVINGSVDDENMLREKWDNKIELLVMEENTGFTGANNAGIYFALSDLKAESIVLLNNDAYLEKDALSQMNERLFSDKKIGMVVPKIYFAPKHEFHTGYQKTDIGKVFWYAGGQIDWTEVYGFHRGMDEVDRGQFETATQTPFATGCCVAIKAELLQTLGAFDDRYFLYFEDLELSQRFYKNSFSVMFEPKAVCWHVNAGSSGSGSELHQYYQTRNRFLFGFSYAPLRTKIFLVRHLLILLSSGQPAVKRAILDFVLQRYGINRSFHTT